VRRGVEKETSRVRLSNCKEVAKREENRKKIAERNKIITNYKKKTGYVK
jgi:hypothetical protein